MWTRTAVRFQKPMGHSPIGKVVEQGPHVCLFLQPTNAASIHKQMQELRHMQIASGIKTKRHKQSSLGPSQVPG